jgi:hypothetical protein
VVKDNMVHFDLKKGFDAFRKERVDYVRPYTFNTPVVMSAKTAEELRLLGIIISKAVRHMADNYLKYLNVFPRSRRELEILRICDSYPYTVGSFRADFVISRNGKVKIIEFNARQPLNGYFESAYFYDLAAEQARKRKITGIRDYYSGFYDYIDSSIGNAARVCVVYETALPADRNFYPQLFRKSGIPCHLIKLSELKKKAHLLKNAWVICEFSIEEIFELSDDAVELLAQHRCLNSLKAALHSGNKLFLCALTDDSFLKDALTLKEISLVKRYIVPTYTYTSIPEIWADAKRNQEKYIIKHQNKGMSEDIFVGKLTPVNEWEKLLASRRIKEMVLQKFIEQKKIKGFVGSEYREDFATGILLYSDNEFFGPGLYRTCSSPVFSNKLAFRKIAPLISGSIKKLPGIYYV